ncbi:uncharacterized protein LY79DRAFT_550211 [Colletotrichum navitas]|uniref:Transmembrane protein n=1 Tax=Colletotrichum navitas TaxID=681940 RepID=A0AAD8V6D9_9PEZI|nr:uncharacterized protein LY79DRAFT_550211 [Colletotrichum navitas]KAK1594228.1 hypothetical protein LY79DRAFT_550211 [Colletotrichum navitas]
MASYLARRCQYPRSSILFPSYDALLGWRASCVSGSSLPSLSNLPNRHPPLVGVLDEWTHESSAKCYHLRLFYSHHVLCKNRLHAHGDKMPCCYPGCIKQALATLTRSRRRGLSRALRGISRCRSALPMKFWVLFSNRVFFIFFYSYFCLFFLASPRRRESVYRSHRPGPYVSQICGNRDHPKYRLLEPSLRSRSSSPVGSKAVNRF